MDDNRSAFLRVLDPADNSTGGGTASAVAGAMAAALVAMVARLSISKKGMAPDSFYHGIASEAEELSKRLFAGGHQDSLAFAQVQAAFKRPKDTQEQQVARREDIQAAVVHAARVPLENAEHCGRIMVLWEKLQGRSNPNAASDLECAGLLARAALLGCLANVSINLPFIADEPLAEELARRAGALRASALRDQ